MLNPIDSFDQLTGTETILGDYDTLAQMVTELVDGKLEAGRYSYQWDARDVASGMYIYELRAYKFISVKKMLCIKKLVS